MGTRHCCSCGLQSANAALTADENSPCLSDKPQIQAIIFKNIYCETCKEMNKSRSHVMN